MGSVGSGIGGWVVSSITFPLFLSHRLFAPPTPLPIPNTHVSTSALALLLYLHVYRDTLCKIAWGKSHNHLHKCIQQLHLESNRVRQLSSPTLLEDEGGGRLGGDHNISSHISLNYYFWAY